MLLDQLADHLRRVLEAHCHDGTEVYRSIDRYLPGLENGAPLTAAAIKSEIKSQYANSIPIDLAIELVMTFFETEFAHERE